MVIFMSGFPFSGKSHIVSLLKEKLPDLIIIDPKEYRKLVDGYDMLSEEDKRDINISSWQCALERLEDLIREGSQKDKIVFDTTCATEQLFDYFKLARSRGHKIVYLFVHADLKTCRERAGKDWISEEVVKKYQDNFKRNILEFKNLSDLCSRIDNSGEINLEKVIEKINGC